jgi:hypothetical protein
VGLKKNTGDLQWKMEPNYNASPCPSEKKPPAQEQWETIEKTMRGAMETIGNQDARLRSVVPPTDRTGAARDAQSGGPWLSAEFVGGPGRN